MLKANWSIEAAEDMRNWQGDIRQQLTDNLAKDIQAEIDKKILQDLYNAWGCVAEPKEEVKVEVKKVVKKYRSIDDPWTDD